MNHEFDADTVTRYVAGTLDEDELDPFEIHLLTCETCQAEVRLGAAARAVLRDSPATLRGSPATLHGSRPTRRTRALQFLVMPLAAAAAILIIVTRDSPMERLGRLDEAAAFESFPIRAADSDAIRMTNAGMAAYRAGDFAEAARVLGEVQRIRPSEAVSFFRGVALLQSGDARAAITALRDVSITENTYSAEAHYYSAKAWLQLGVADSALARLAKVSPTTPLRVRADALADSVRAIR